MVNRSLHPLSARMASEQSDGSYLSFESSGVCSSCFAQVFFIFDFLLFKNVCFWFCFYNCLSLCSLSFSDLWFVPDNDLRIFSIFVVNIPFLPSSLPWRPAHYSVTPSPVLVLWLWVCFVLGFPRYLFSFLFGFRDCYGDIPSQRVFLSRGHPTREAVSSVTCFHF